MTTRDIALLVVGLIVGAILGYFVFGAMQDGTTPGTSGVSESTGAGGGIPEPEHKGRVLGSGLEPGQRLIVKTSGPAGTQIVEGRADGEGNYELNFERQGPSPDSYVLELVGQAEKHEWTCDEPLEELCEEPFDF